MYHWNAEDLQLVKDLDQWIRDAHLCNRWCCPNTKTVPCVERQIHAIPCEQPSSQVSPEWVEYHHYVRTAGLGPASELPHTLGQFTPDIFWNECNSRTGCGLARWKLITLNLNFLCREKMEPEIIDFCWWSFGGKEKTHWILPVCPYGQKKHPIPGSTSRMRSGIVCAPPRR